MDQMNYQDQPITDLPRRESQMPYDQAYSPVNFNTSLTLDEIDVFRKRLIHNISELNINKHRLRGDEYNQLINYHNYALNILNNMQNIKRVELANPYNRNMYSVMGGQVQPGIDTINPYETQMKVIYLPDGRTKLIPNDQFAKHYKEEWETQFSEQLINPPTYTLPPNNCWALPRKGQ